MRKTVFANDEHYHIYNRGTDKREVFADEKDYHKFLLCLDLLNDEDAGLMALWRDLHKKTAAGFPKVQPWASPRLNLRKPLVSIIAYCLNPNHYHFILKQKEDRGIEKFMQKLGTSYTMYFNKKYSRSGVLFQGRFKAIHITSNEYLLYLSAYVNGNNFIHKYNKDMEAWPYASYLDYVGKRDGKLCDKEIILGQFDNDFSQYTKYIRDNAQYLKEKKEMEKYALE